MIRRDWAVALGFGLALFASPALTAEPTLNERARDIRDLRDAALSPDARQLAAVVGASTAEGGQTHLWLLSTDGKQARQVTVSGADTEAGERAPGWANDGSALFFIAKRGRANRLYRLPTAGGEAEALVIARPASGALKSGWRATADDAVEADVRSYAVSPDDRRIALIAADGQTAARAAQVTKKDDAVRVAHDDVPKARLYLSDATGGEAREIALPDDVQSAAWSPDGGELLVVTAPADEDLAPAARLWRVDAASGKPAEVAGVPNTIRSAAWAAGRVAYLAQCEDDAPPGCADLYVRDLAGGAARNLTRGLKGSLPDSFIVTRDGKSAVAPIYVGVRQTVARIDLASGAIAWIGAPAPVINVVRTNVGQTGWAFQGSGPTQPRAYYFAAGLGDAPVKLAGPALLPAGWPMTTSKVVTWKNRGLDIEGLLYLPKTPPGAKAPLVVLVHGGPSGVWQDRYSNLVNLLVAEGWAVLEPNPRGSTGYGAKFNAANKNDLGGGDYADIMAGVDAVLARHPLDPARMALIGYSYGGEMAAFAAGRTNRFKALVSGAPVIDQFSEYGTEDSSFYDRWYFGKPWERFADAWRQSPLARVGQAKTPLLLLQGEDDPTDPLGQSQEMHRAMRQVGAPVVLVTYPRETHATLGRAFFAEPSREPWHGVDVRRRMLAFIADAFAGKPPAAAP